MNKNETLAPKELESINGEMFQSFDPDDASWITGGKITYSILATVGTNGEVEAAYDIQVC